MKDALKKLLAGKAPVAQEQEPAGAVASSVESALAGDLQAALSQVESLNQLLQERESVVAEMTAKLESLSAYAEQAEAAAEALRVEAENKALEVKREKLAAVIGAQNPGFEATFAAISGLEEAAFQTVVDGFAASFKAESKTEMFTEVGVSGEADQKANADGESPEMKIIKQKASKK